MASTVTKKNSYCRYYIRYGDCFHGENCQFIHAYPPQATPQPQPVAKDVPLHQIQPTTPSVQQQQSQLQQQQLQLQLQQQVQQQQQQQQQQAQPQNHQPGYAMNKLICSFKSDLPNEIDFAMQVATLLANTDNFVWNKDYPLVDAICSSLHVFVCVCGDSSINCYCYPRFWRKLIVADTDTSQYLEAATLPPDVDKSFMNFDALIDHDLKDHSKIYRRIKTAAELIKQFSMTIGILANEKRDDYHPQNNYNYHQMKKKKLKSSPSLLKFVSLLLHCNNKHLNLIGLDILSNTASKLSKIPDTTNDPNCAKLVQIFQEHCVDCITRQDGDIYIVNRSFEVVSRLISCSSRRVSCSINNLITEKNLVLRVEQFLTSQYDVTLFLSALECCYRISRHQPQLLTNGKYLLKILVNLLNVEETRYFTPNALKKIKLIDEEEPTPVLQPLTKAQANNCKPVQVLPKIIQQKNGVQVSQPETKEYPCEWDNCDARFEDSKKVYSHVFDAHIEKMAPDSLSSCLWTGPNGAGPGCLTKRPKYSLLTHLNDFHCNQVALNRTDPVKPPEHPGYAANAALLAIRRHANAQSEASKNQSPLSTSVRITAALILRNLAKECSNVKNALENHEPLLSEICMSNGRDESKIIAECLSLFSEN